MLPWHYRLAARVGAVWLLLVMPASLVLAQTWMPTSLPTIEYYRVACSSDGETLLVGAWSGPIYASTNSGTTWLALSPPVPPGSLWEHVGSSWHGLACSADGSTLLGAAANAALCVSTNLGQTWTETLCSDLFQAAACSADGKRLLAVANAQNPGATTSGIYLSSDGGISWTLADVPWLWWSCGASSADGRTLAIGGPTSTVYVSTNWGQSWNANSLGLPFTYTALACSADGTRMIAGSYAPGGLFTSSDSGATWTSLGFTNWSLNSVACSADGKKLAAAAYGGPIYRSTDSGASWTIMDAPLTNWCALASSADGNTLVAAIMTQDYARLGLAYTCHLTPTPELKLTSAGQDVVLSWTLPSRPCVLEESSGLSNSEWTAVTTAPLLNYTNLQNQVTVPKMPGSRFYRLRVE